MKLQELLDTHKHKLWDWWYNQLVIDNGAWENYQWIIIDWRVNDNPMSEFSLSDLLFSTPFLSLLERKIDASEKVWIHQYIKDERFIEWYSTYENYHKINLVLLNTDEERISYLENNTI